VALLSGALLAARAAPLQAQAEKRPNIVVLVADDLGWHDTGVYGNAAIRTPNIDRLARSGLLVKLAFGTSPQCSPSRISVLTGTYPHATGAEDLHMPLPEGERILPSYLQGRGYFTGPRFFDMDAALLKRIAITERMNLEFRADATNLTNTPSFGLPTATITSTTFGRIRDNVESSSRKVQLGAKFNF